MKKLTYRKKTSLLTKILIAVLLVTGVFTVLQRRAVFRLAGDNYRLQKESQGVVAAAVTVTASVPDNEYNALAKELHDKELKLAQEEKAIEAKKKEADQKLQSFYMLAAALFILILLNFYLDHRRDKRNMPRTA